MELVTYKKQNKLLETAVRRIIEMLEDYYRRTGKKFLKVDLTETSDRDENGIDRSGEDGWSN